MPPPLGQSLAGVHPEQAAVLHHNQRVNLPVQVFQSSEEPQPMGTRQVGYRIDTSSAAIDHSINSSQEISPSQIQLSVKVAGGQPKKLQELSPAKPSEPVHKFG